ncbi:MAG: hypothetical protein HY738_06520, partial [Bacteroidia bacterium]|nr:hypothetical protein [Bacteroidia bacterium]
MTKDKRYFNTSGPNIPEEHYTLMRENLIAKGIDLVDRKRYFTIWAPRQTGKSTFFRLLADELTRNNYHVAHINVENFQSATESGLIEHITREIKEQTRLGIKATDFLSFFDKLKVINNLKFVFIIDEIEGINP